MLDQFKEKVNYQELIELGFERVEMSDDNVHYKRYGYPYFILAYGEDGVDQITMEWSPVNQEVNMYINSQTYQKALSLDEVKDIVKMLKEKI